MIIYLPLAFTFIIIVATYMFKRHIESEIIKHIPTVSSKEYWFTRLGDSLSLAYSGLFAMALFSILYIIIQNNHVHSYRFTFIVHLAVPLIGIFCVYLLFRFKKDFDRKYK